MLKLPSLAHGAIESQSDVSLASYLPQMVGQANFPCTLRKEERDAASAQKQLELAKERAIRPPPPPPSIVWLFGGAKMKPGNPPAEEPRNPPEGLRQPGARTLRVPGSEQLEAASLRSAPQTTIPFCIRPNFFRLQFGQDPG